MNDIRLGTLIAVCSAMIFGLYPAAIRGVYLNGGNAVLVLMITTWAQLAVLVALCLLKGRRLFHEPGAGRSALLGGVFQALSMIGFICALKFLAGPLMIIVLFLYPLMLLFFMVCRGEAKLDRWTVLTTLAALVGLTFVLDVWHSEGKGHLAGMALALLAAVATASRLYVYGKQTRDRNPAVVGAETFLVASILILPTALFQMPQLPASGQGYIYLLLASASLGLGTLGMFYGVALLGSFRWGLFLKLEPVFTALFSMLFLGEVLKPLQYVGMAVVLGSLAAYQISAHKPKKLTQQNQ